MQAYTEQEIIERCLKKDRQMQEHLYKTYYSILLKTCVRYVQDMHMAEQLLNDSFLKIYTHLHTYSTNGSFEGWMKRIAINTCLDYLKSSALKTSVRMTVNSDFVVETIISTTNEALDKIQFKELLGMIQALPATTRTVFNLFVLDGYTHKEIAAMLSISEGTSYWHVNKARSLLQEQINASKNRSYEYKRI